MQVVTSTQWEQFIEGMRRRDIGPFVQLNEIEDNDRFRLYYDDDTLVASMKVVDALGPKPGHENERVFKIDKTLVEATAYIFIPTQEQWDEWDDPYNGTDSMAEAARIDSGWLK
jgi:hypothetical protein